MKRILIITLLFISTIIFGQNNTWVTVADEIKIQKIDEDQNSDNLKTGDSIIIIDYSTLNFKNKEIQNSKLIGETTAYGNGIVNSGASLIKPEEIYKFKRNSKYKIYQPNFLHDEIALEVLLSENTSEEELTLLTKKLNSLHFICSTRYLSPRESITQKYDSIFGKGKYSYSMVSYSVQRGTLLVYFDLSEITKRNITILKRSLSTFSFINEILGIELLLKGVKGNFIMMET